MYNKDSHKAISLSFILCLFFLLISCGKEGNESPEEKKEVKLIIHAWEGYAEEYKEDFIRYAKEKLNLNVKIEITNTTGFDSNVDYITNHDAHLISPANDLLLPLYRRNLIQSIDRSKIKKFNQINPLILETKAFEIEGKTFAVPFNFGPVVIAYNKDKMNTPTTYKVLWDPKYKKRVTFPSLYETISIYLTALMLNMPKADLFNLSDAQLSLIENKLRYLFREQVSDYWEENLVPSHYMNFDIGIDWGIGVSKINQGYSGNWGCVVPEEGTTGWIDTWAVSTNVKIEDTELWKVIYAWLDFMIAPQTQAKVARITSYGPVNPYAGRYLTAREKEQYYLTDPDFMNKIVLWQPLSEEVFSRYQKTWARAKNNSPKE